MQLQKPLRKLQKPQKTLQISPRRGPRAASIWSLRPPLAHGPRQPRTMKVKNPTELVHAVRIRALG